MTDQAQNHWPREPWHLSRAISITHIISTITIVGVLFGYLSAQNERISNNELNIKHLQQSAIEDRQAAERRYDDFRTDLRSISSKLDRLIEYTRDQANGR